MKKSTKEPIFIGMGEWAKYAISVKFTNELAVANDWVLPLMNAVGIPSSELTAIMASTDKRLVFSDLICNRLAEGRKDVWLPSVSRKILDQAEKQFDNALQGIIDQQPACKNIRQRLADLENYHESYMKNPEPFLNPVDKERIKEMRARGNIKGIDELLQVGRDLRNERHATVMRNVETAAEEAKEQALARWESIARTSYNLTNLMGIIDTDELQEGRLTISKEKAREKYGTWARTDNEQLLYDMLSKVCEMLNDLHLDNDPKTVFEHMTETVNHREIRIRHDLEKDFFRRTAKSMKV